MSVLVETSCGALDDVLQFTLHNWIVDHLVAIFVGNLDLVCLSKFLTCGWSGLGISICFVT